MSLTATYLLNVNTSRGAWLVEIYEPPTLDADQAIWKHVPEDAEPLAHARGLTLEQAAARALADMAADAAGIG